MVNVIFLKSLSLFPQRNHLNMDDMTSCQPRSKGRPEKYSNDEERCIARNLSDNKYYETHKEEVKARAKLNYELNKEKKKKSMREYYERNKLAKRGQGNV